MFYRLKLHMVILATLAIPAADACQRDFSRLAHLVVEVRFDSIFGGGYSAQELCNLSRARGSNDCFANIENALKEQARKQRKNCDFLNVDAKCFSNQNPEGSISRAYGQTILSISCR